MTRIHYPHCLDLVIIVWMPNSQCGLKTKPLTVMGPLSRVVFDVCLCALSVAYLMFAVCVCPGKHPARASAVLWKQQEPLTQVSVPLEDSQVVYHMHRRAEREVAWEWQKRCRWRHHCSFAYSLQLIQSDTRLCLTCGTFFISHARLGDVLDVNRFSMLLNQQCSSGVFVSHITVCVMWGPVPPPPCLELLCLFCPAELLCSQLGLGESDVVFHFVRLLWLWTVLIFWSDKVEGHYLLPFCHSIYNLQHSVSKQPVLLSFSTWPT